MYCKRNNWLDLQKCCSLAGHVFSYVWSSAVLKLGFFSFSPAPVRSVIFYWSRAVDINTAAHCSTDIAHLCSTVPVNIYKVNIVIEIKSEADVWQIEVDVDVEQVIEVGETWNTMELLLIYSLVFELSSIAMEIRM